MKLRFLNFIFILLTVSACNSKNETETLSQTSKFTYEFKEKINGYSCTTGSRSFKTMDEYCDGLRRSTDNNNCALQIRKLTYEERCNGDFEDSETSQ